MDGSRAGSQLPVRLSAERLQAQWAFQLEVEEDRDGCFGKWEMGVRKEVRAQRRAEVGAGKRTDLTSHIAHSGGEVA